jgi:hypothetical protein
MVTAMADDLAAARAPATTVTEVAERLEAIEAALPAEDGLARFNRMYLEVTREINSKLSGDYFDDPDFMKHLNVAFANRYFEAVDAANGSAPVPLAWRPLVDRRDDAGIEAVQFALAGMNAHINHDLPLALVSTCTALATEPDAGSHFADYQKVDNLLYAKEQSIRHSLETRPELEIDEHLKAVNNLVVNWTIADTRDAAWTNCRGLWAVRDVPGAHGLYADGLARSVAISNRLLLVAV